MSSHFNAKGTVDLQVLPEKVSSAVLEHELLRAIGFNGTLGTAYYHVGFDNDLMSGAIDAGQLRNLSKLDLAMLKDIGAPVLVGISTSA